MQKIFAILLASSALAACSSIVEGTHQDIAVATDPSGANCALKRDGYEIGRILSTPGTAHVEKTKHDITIVCEKDGYQQATYVDRSDAAAATFGNIVAGGLIGWGIDSATGADNKYEAQVNIKLEPVKAAQNGGQH